jgi:putative addiction module CopG family antidote
MTPDLSLYLIDAKMNPAFSQEASIMNVSIPAELEGFVQSLVVSGDYRNPDEVVGTALKMLQHKEKLRREIQAGIDELDQGQGRDADDVFARLMEKARALSGISGGNK